MISFIPLDGFWPLDDGSGDVSAGVVLIRKENEPIATTHDTPFDLYTPAGLVISGRLHRALMEVRHGESR